MLRIAKKGYERSHAIGVEPVHTVEDLIKIIDSHRTQFQERFCPFFVALRGGLRIARWAARDPNGTGFLIRVEENCPAEFVEQSKLMTSKSFGRYMQEGRMFYDALNLETTSNLQTMQRLS